MRSTQMIRWLMALALVALSGCSTTSDPADLDIFAPDTSSAPETNSAPEASSPVQVDPARVIEHLKAAGLPIGRVDSFNADNDPFEHAGQPGRYASKVVFLDTRHNEEACVQLEVIEWDECGGTVEVFNSVEDMRKWTETIELARAQIPNAPPEYRYEKNLSLLRLGHILTPAEAQAYETAYAAFSG